MPCQAKQRQIININLCFNASIDTDGLSGTESELENGKIFSLSSGHGNTRMTCFDCSILFSVFLLIDRFLLSVPILKFKIFL